MKRILIATVVLLTLYIPVTAEQFSYSYDSAGNRVKREIVLQKSADPEKKRKLFFTESLADKEIKIHPNPTYGDLSVEIKGYEDTDACTFSIYNMSGQMILTEKAVAPTTGVDIGSQPNGIYILHITLNGEESSWKIIKK